MTIQPRTMPGVLELLPLEQAAFDRFLATIREGYARFGFLPVETPVIELRDVLLTKSGGDTEKQVYFVSSTGTLNKGDPPKLALRFDLTVPLARYVAQHEHQLAFPFRRYQIQRVYRGESAQRGRFREFYQCDVDVVGKDTLGLHADAELPALIHAVFTDLGVGAFTIHISNRKILRGLLSSLGVVAPDRVGAILREIDKVDKRGRDAVEETLASGDFGLDDAGRSTVLETIALRGTRAEVVPALRALDVDDPTFTQGVDELEQVLEAIADYGVPQDAYLANLAIARGLDYYTGTVYETLLDDHRAIGSVCSGGRYDDLATHYTKSKLPGVGISIGATRLFEQLRSAGLLGGDAASPTKVLVTRMDAALGETYRRVATELRRAGVNTELFGETTKLGKQFKYATKAKIRYAVVIGEQEANNDTLQFKDLDTGEQEELTLATLVERLAE